MNRARVLLDRGPKLFKKTVPIQDRQYELADSHKVLEPLKGIKEHQKRVHALILLVKQWCSLAQAAARRMQTTVPSLNQFRKVAEVKGSSVKQSLCWTSQKVAMSPDKQEKLGKAWGDLVSETRLRQKTAPPPQPGTEIAQSQAVAPSSSTATPPSAEAATEDSCSNKSMT